MRILAYPSPGNAREYRLDQVARQINAQSQSNFYVSNKGMVEQDLRNADVVVLEQTTSPEKIKLARDITRETKSLLVAEVDDAFGVNPDSPFKEKHEELEATKWLECLCGVSDLVTTTTDYLANMIKSKLRQHGVKKEVAVLPNYLESSLWEMPIRKNYNGEVRILWAGSCTHRADMKYIAPVIHQICQKYPQVKFIHCGDVELIPLFQDINSEYVEGVPFRAWPARLHSLRADIGVAPLLDTEFNRCKTNLKFLEYSIAGIAGVYSDIVYAKTVKDGVTGLIAKNEEEFFEKICLLIENQGLREEISAMAYLEAKMKYNIENHALDWLNAYWYHLSKIRSLKIDVGSGIIPIIGYVHLDALPQYGEMVADILNGIPVANESVERLHASAIIEHFYLHELKEKVLPEFYRV